MNRIGTIEILRVRIYALDAECAHHTSASTVVVEPGQYELFSDGMTTFWMMRGKLNRRWERMGDGLFGMRDGDDPSDIEVVFPSRRFGPDEWADLLQGSEFADGPDQRLIVRLEVSA